MTLTALANMVNTILYPNPEDSGAPHNPFGPYGPGGPVMLKALWAMLNPQPLPPGPDPYRQLSWVSLNPQPLPPGPDPYRTAAYARSAIEYATAQLQFAELAGSELLERGIIIVGGRVRNVVDEWCGTRIPGHHGPRPHAVNLLAAAAQFQNAADSPENSPLQTVFEAAAHQLFTVGLSRLEARSEGHST